MVDGHGGVGAIDLPSSPLDESAEQLRQAGVDAVTLQRDITHPDQVSTTMARVRDGFGPIDVLINNAGKTSALLSFLAPDLYERLMVRNLRSELT